MPRITKDEIEALANQAIKKAIGPDFTTQEVITAYCGIMGITREEYTPLVLLEYLTAAEIYMRTHYSGFSAAGNYLDSAIPSVRNALRPIRQYTETERLRLLDRERDLLMSLRHGRERGTIDNEIVRILTFLPSNSDAFKVWYDDKIAPDLYKKFPRYVTFATFFPLLPIREGEDAWPPQTGVNSKPPPLAAMAVGGGSGQQGPEDDIDPRTMDRLKVFAARARKHCDVIVLDAECHYDNPEVTGLRLASELKALCPELRVVAVKAHGRFTKDDEINANRLGIKLATDKTHSDHEGSKDVDTLLKVASCVQETLDSRGTLTEEERNDVAEFNLRAIVARLENGVTLDKVAALLEAARHANNKSDIVTLLDATVRLHEGLNSDSIKEPAITQCIKRAHLSAKIIGDDGKAEIAMQKAMRTEQYGVVAKIRNAGGSMQRFIKMIGENVGAENLPDFLVRMETELKAGAFINVRLPENAIRMVNAGETPLDYYLRLERLYDEVHQAADLPGEAMSAPDEHVASSKPVIMQAIVQLLKRYGAKTSAEMDLKNTPPKPAPRGAVSR